MSHLFAQADKMLLVDANSGIAGDMFLTALIELGFDIDRLQEALATAGLGDLKLETNSVRSHGLAATSLKVRAEADQPHRKLEDCLTIVRAMGLPTEAEALAERFFHRLAEVEGRRHGLPPAEVHFHEVGAIDSIVDLAGAALGLYELGVGSVRVRHLAIGGGEVAAAHGRLPLPAPATLDLLAGFHLTESGLDAELVTPTGAVILAETASPAPPGLTWTPLRVGYGAGTRELPDRPNLLRLTLSTCASDQGLIATILPVLRCTIDDMNPERYGYLMDKLFDAGARDVQFRPLQMKKNRPGQEIVILCGEEILPRITDILFRETTTLGLRISREERLELPRESVDVTTRWGDVSVKVALLPDGTRRASPEHDSCARLAARAEVSLAEVEDEARAVWRRETEERKR